ncbi:conserved hypothetical protein [Uncinocarpus reesii 1704]|uniref:Amino acid permease/ SLC12A domain-containing protein n=1 Tax=Uncinocarpus reesii (strain UAMH 1704) TaxID=336963 RepID=C4JWL8_UNCRE|nr:uncharacterized protein UREG_06960 [Uncinocarpus reesii 1704]EEP82095.1 conserved hypothetical protein [Uncinocarpus reesii 1704]
MVPKLGKRQHLNGGYFRFAYAVLAADQLVAATNSVKFHYEDEHTLLSWKVGENVHAAVWITLVLVVVTIVNMFPVKVFGQLEYIFGSIKLAFISFLILMSVLIDTMKPRANAYYNKPLGTKYWDAPYGFFNRQFPIKDENGNLQRMMTGSMGSFLGMWTTLINVIFSYVGMDIVAATAAESKALADSEAMKMASRKVSLRIITTYALTVLTASFTVPMDHRFLNGEAQSVGAQSIFIIAVVEAGMPAMAHFYNAMYLFSAFTCAINSMYVASRVLHTLALRDQTGPEWITKRLRLCHAGVPVRTVLVTAALMLVAYMGPTGAPGLVCKLKHQLSTE